MNKNNKLQHRLYGIVTEEYCLGRDVLTVARHMIEGGVRILQYREKDKSKKEKYLDCVKLRQLTEENDVTFIVNDDVDIALAVRADGVHLGQGDIPLVAARSLAGNGLIIGLSTHSPGQAQEAVALGADYIGVGPIYPTRTKKDACPAVGLSYLDYVVKSVPIPFVAIGGIKRHNLEEVLRHGAPCVALVTEIISAPDIRGTIAEITAILEKL